jgi:pimeloyl-ACP methyl ester carboxylesterase
MANGLAIAAGCLAGVPAAGWLYQKWGERRDQQRHAAPGRMVETERGRFHVWRIGEAGPGIVLESGIAASCLNWRLVHEPLGARAQTFAYDRAGFGWSPAARQPRVMPALVEELRLVLEAGEVPLPTVLVGHSFGGWLVRHFAARYPSKVRGLVLVDPLEPFEWDPISEAQRGRLGKGVMLSRRGALLARLGVVRGALSLLLAGSTGLPRMISKASSGKGSAVPDRIVGELRRLPKEWWPVIASHWCLPRSFETMAEYLERLPENCSYGLDEGALARIPTTVISGERTAPAVIAAHERTAAASAGGRHVVSAGSGHWIHLDNPALVVAEVERMAGL